MRRVRLAAAAAALTLAGLVIFPAPAACAACSCSIGAEAEYVAAADTIFIGVVTTTTDSPSAQGGMASTEFRILRMIKGVAGSPPRVISPAGGGASCGLDFVEGGTYRVYSKEGRTSLCSGTRVQGTPGPQPNIDGLPVVWLAVGGGLAVAALILYFLHIRRL